MKKALSATQQEFESASYKTPEYLAWYRLFKREFKKFLEGKGMTGIEIGKPNHFDMHGFFKDGAKDQIWYFSISDLRWSKESMLIRTAKHYKDFTGRMNQYIPLMHDEQKFTDAFNRIVSNGNVPSSGNLITDINAAQQRYLAAAT